MGRRKPFNIFREGKVHVVRPVCATCIYRPLSAGVGDAIVAKARAEDNVVVCHSTLGTKENAVCGGYFAAERTTPIVLAKLMGNIEYVKPVDK